MFAVFVIIFQPKFVDSTSYLLAKIPGKICHDLYVFSPFLVDVATYGDLIVGVPVSGVDGNEMQDPRPCPRAKKVAKFMFFLAARGHF